MTTPEDRLRWLVTRLTWPSLLVRERACSALAQLLVDPIYGEITRVFLARWIREQLLESTACDGLLVLVHAQLKHADVMTPLIAEVAASFSQHSLLSWLLFQELLPNYPILTPTTLRHAPDSPVDWQPSSFFEKHAKSFLPPIYMFWAEDLERVTHLGFVRQWSYEWHQLMDQLGITPSAKPLDFWIGRRTDNERYAGADLRLSDVYRSAYLRTLAWAINRQGISEQDALWFAAQTCPVDLELWQVRPHFPPSWWPRLSTLEEPVDTSAATIWQQVSQLWNAQQEHDAQWPSREQVLAYASGAIHSQHIVYELRIYGVFQRREGVDSPQLQEIIDWYVSTSQIDATFVTPLRCRGELASAPVSRLAKSFDGWRVIPVASILPIPTTPRWQMWRIKQRIWGPAPCILPATTVVHAEDDNLVFQTRDGSIGIWSDWTEDLHEKRADELPFLTGQQLLLSRSLVTGFTRASTSAFCWICRLRGFYRGRNYEPYSHVDDVRVFGATSVVRV